MLENKKLSLSKNVEVCCFFVCNSSFNCNSHRENKMINNRKYHGFLFKREWKCTWIVLNPLAILLWGVRLFRQGGRVAEWITQITQLRSKIMASPFYSSEPMSSKSMGWC